ncbi:DNA gyrase subunit A [Candidatus Photodesmus katoptron]|uniref:DNA gyrase subunit A n=1 Tax=Candidatus Photodesmus katoptron Akat1 TaxID=1236703 RepID=S3DH39_9GAMM|nr:DNA topoisomerase (ATP-hydrolyzing) subunit A [Candidatus Photodesmus katoptron]EPE37762.1 DNA gyrase subunit A [Candidatus Photodesmus katoptron Akat1]KEY90516.1 DNA gyrase subunit A [Candidatus Photodesmus katoptron]
MSDQAKEIIPINIEDELKASYLDYAMSVIVGRALPDVRDGLKPVHRRVLFAMNILGNDWNKGYKKSARVVGDVIGKYHPHGDTAVYDTIVRMAQSFSLRYMLIDGQGNFGSIDGDSAAAMRYTEVRMSKISHKLLEDLDKETVDYVPNYDNTEQIPTVLPTKIPNLLVNGASGIAVGMATNIPPHNLTEIINACLAYINNEKITIDELMDYIPGPDFPTSAIISGRKGILDAYKTGRGKIHVRSKTKIETDKKHSKEAIIITEIPYQVNKSRLIEKIAELVKDKKIEGISVLRDESDKDGMRIVIECKRDALGEIVLNNLYAHTQLQTTFGINMVALNNNGQPQLFNLKDMLKSFINHRREIVTRRTIFKLKKTCNRTHTLEALTLALENIDEIIELVRKTKLPAEAKSNLLGRGWKTDNIVLKKSPINATHLDFLEKQHTFHGNKYFLTEKQAQAILDLRLHKLTSLEHKKILTEYKILLNEITELTKILENTDRLMEVISEELKLIREDFGDNRRTKITSATHDIDMESLIARDDVVITLSHEGYVKYQLLRDYEPQRRGGKGRSATRMKEEDYIERLLVTNTHDSILCFSTRGKTYQLKVYQLPLASRIARGKPIINILPLEEQERITAILPVSQFNSNKFVFMATRNGIVKKTSLQKFSNVRSNGLIAINLHDDDLLIGVDITNGNSNAMLFSKFGKVVRFKEEKVREMGRAAAGIRGMKLVGNDQVVSLIVPANQGNILTVTQNGYGKRTELFEYPIKGRATQGVVSIKISERNGSVVSAVQVEESDEVMIITNTGTLVRTRVSEISQVGRNTQGVILIRTTEHENVVGLQCIDDVEEIKLPNSRH